MQLERYTENHFKLWNRIVGESRNSTFFFNRNYLDYHKHLFHDHSLIVFDQSKPIALLPANEINTAIYSHAGLTYGGLLLLPEIKLIKTLAIFFKVLKYYFDFGYDELIYKPVPSFYHQIKTDEDLYALFLVKGELFRRDTGFVIDLKSPLPYQERRKRSIVKAAKQGLEIKKTETFDEFWTQVLEPNLFSRFGVKPVHSVEQITQLKEKNPGNIVQYNIYWQEMIVGGCTLFINQNAVHAQYISSTEEGKQIGALDFLFDYLIKKEFSGFKYFSFGISNENNGLDINEGLTEWKESFGARAWIHDFYKINTSNYYLLEKYDRQ